MQNDEEINAAPMADDEGLAFDSAEIAKRQEEKQRAETVRTVMSGMDASFNVSEGPVDSGRDGDAFTGVGIKMKMTKSAANPASSA